jgi:hypothetical protein
VDVIVAPRRETPSLIVASLSSTVKKGRATRPNPTLETADESDEPPLLVTGRGNHSHHLTWVATWTNRAQRYCLARRLQWAGPHLI